MKNLLNLKSWLLMMCLLVGVGSAWAEDIALNCGSLGLTSTSYNTSFSKKLGEVTFNSNNIAKNSAGIAIKASGQFWNSTAFPGEISKIEFTKLSFSSSTNATFTIYGGTSAKAETEALATITDAGATSVDFTGKGYSYFIIKNGSSRALYFEATITYSSSASTDPTINASNVTIESDATSGEIAYTITNPATNVNPTATITAGDWISNVAVNTTTGKITFDATANTASTERTATITISYTGANSKTVTITQKKHVVTTTYNKVSASEMVIGGTHVLFAQKDTKKSVATGFSGTNTYLSSADLAAESQLTDTQLILTSEEPQLFILDQTSGTEWTISNSASKYLTRTDDKKIAWKDEVSKWTVSGTDIPKFAQGGQTLFANLGSTRFTVYTSSSTSTQDAIIYHLASESAHTLSCVIDNETTKKYIVKDAYSWKLLTPEKDGYVFLGWAGSEDGIVIYADGAEYMMPHANATLYAKWRQQTNAPVFTTDLTETYNCNKGGDAVALTVEATDADSYQWYKNSTASTDGATAIDGATEASYNYTGTAIGTEYVYCVATNAVGSTTSTIAAVTTAGSNLAVLSHIEFSNGFDAFIKNNTVTAYYMAGTTAPTVNKSSVVVSDGAEFDVDATTLTVLAEDGETMVDYTIVLSPVTPNTTAAAEAAFDGTETWVKTGYTFDNTKGWAFAKNVEDNTPRISEGRNRQYWFVGPATEFTLINGGVTSDRNIKVYVNGVEQTGITKIEKASGNNTISITGLSATDNNMVAIVSNNTGGDGGFTKYTLVPAVAPVPTFASLDDLIAANQSYEAVNVTIDDKVFAAKATAGKYLVMLTNSQVTLASSGEDLGWLAGGTVTGTLTNVSWDNENGLLMSQEPFWSSLTYKAPQVQVFASIDELLAANLAHGTTVTVTVNGTITEVREVEGDGAYVVVLDNTFSIGSPSSELNWKVGGTVSGKLENVIFGTDEGETGVVSVSENLFQILNYVAPAEPTSGTITLKAQGVMPGVNDEGGMMEGLGLYFATFSSDKDVIIDAEDLFAVCPVGVEDGYVSALPAETSVAYVTDEDAAVVEGYYIPANTGVMVISMGNEATYYFVATDEENELVEIDPDGINLLRPASQAKETDGSYKFYMLAYGDEDLTPSTLGFYYGADNGAAFDSRVGSAYLAVPAESSLAKGFTFVGGATGIKNVNKAAQNNVMFNLAGQRVLNANGIVIKNGKKFVK